MVVKVGQSFVKERGLLRARIPKHSQEKNYYFTPVDDGLLPVKYKIYF